jgi:hypothetical protein
MAAQILPVEIENLLKDFSPLERQASWRTALIAHFSDIERLLSALSPEEEQKQRPRLIQIWVDKLKAAKMYKKQGFWCRVYFLGAENKEQEILVQSLAKEIEDGHCRTSSCKDSADFSFSAEEARSLFIQRIKTYDYLKISINGFYV